MNFTEANKVNHPVEAQWHYDRMVKHGFVAETKWAIGFVRHYIYNHPDGHKIKVVTGASADYWEDVKNGNFGYHATLEPHIMELVKKDENKT